MIGSKCEKAAFYAASMVPNGKANFTGCSREGVAAVRNKSTQQTEYVDTSVYSTTMKAADAIAALLKGEQPPAPARQVPAGPE